MASVFSFFANKLLFGNNAATFSQTFANKFTEDDMRSKFIDIALDIYKEFESENS